jgi:translation initiation factor IF-1
MPKNTKGGNKTKKLKNSNDIKAKETPLPSQDEDSHIAEITAVLGGYRFRCKIITENGLEKDEILVHLGQGSKKFGFVVLNSIVKISLRDFEKGKGDILYTYSQPDISYLTSNGYMPANLHPEKQSGDVIFTDVSSSIGIDEKLDLETI